MALPYKVHPHAVTAIVKRFGIKPEHATNWANSILAHSVKAYTEHDGREVYQHRTKEVFLAVDPADMLVVTVIDKKIEKVKVKSPFMDAMVPQLERELYKMRRDYTRKRRSLEKTHAEKTLERALTLKRRAAACNPNTQALLATEAKRIELEIRAYEADLMQLKADFEIAEVKVESFMRSIV